VTQQIPFKHSAMMPIYDRFIQTFGSITENKDFDSNLRQTVFIRMKHAFHVAVKPKEARRHFLKNFHPDAGTDVMTLDEKTRVAAMESFIFKGK